MATMTAEHLVEDYLRRLEAAAGDLPRARRAELVQEIREHVEHGLDETGRDEASIRNVLERLGPPEEIVAAAEPPSTVARAGRLEIAAVIALVVPFLGWILGLALVAVSHVWSSRQKTIGIALALVPILLPAVGLTLASAEGTQEPVPVDAPSGSADTSSYEVFLFVAMLLAGLPSAIYLGTRLRNSSRTI
jgi:HAAS domain-containing protein